MKSVWLWLLPPLVSLLLLVCPASASEVVVKLWGGGFCCVDAISVDSSDGSCWVSDHTNHQVAHLSAEGSELWRGGDFDDACSLSVNSADGSCWVADRGRSQVIHLSAEGAELWRGEEFWSPESVSVNPVDGSCWVADTWHSRVMHLAADGSVLGSWDGVTTSPLSVSVNPTDGSCWVAGGEAEIAEIVHLSAERTVLWRGRAGLCCPESISVNSSDGSCWVADSAGHQVVHLAADGSELWRGGLDTPTSISVNSSDGSCWVADSAGEQLVHLAANGSTRWRVGELTYPFFVSVNATDGSCWVATNAPGRGYVAHLGIVPGGWLEDDHPALRYSGTWMEFATPAASGGHAKISSQAGAEVSFTFAGTGFSCYSAKGPKMGKVQVWLDGAGPLLVDLYAPSLQALTSTRTGLKSGSHTVRVRVTGQKNQNSGGTKVILDAFEVVP